MLDKNPFIIDEFMGLHLGSADQVAPIECQDTVPFNYALEAINILFLKDGGIETRGPFFLGKIFPTPEPPPDPPVAEFSWIGPVNPPLNDVDFTDESTGIVDSWDWDFDDGSPHGTTQDPNHVYTDPNITYHVTLTVTNTGGSDSVTHDVFLGT